MVDLPLVKNPRRVPDTLAAVDPVGRHPYDGKDSSVSVRKYENGDGPKASEDGVYTLPGGLSIAMSKGDPLPPGATLRDDEALLAEAETVYGITSEIEGSIDLTLSDEEIDRVADRVAAIVISGLNTAASQAMANQVPSYPPGYRTPEGDTDIQSPEAPVETAAQRKAREKAEQAADKAAADAAGDVQP